MEIKVYKDVSKRPKTLGVLTGSQWLLVIALIIGIGADIANSILGFLPDALLKPFILVVVALGAGHALFRPHGLPFTTWLKLQLKYTTTVQTRIYKQEKTKEYHKNDFKKDKKIKEWR
ncbi:PrgI family protein [Lactococcus garvieae]|uniref:PrgI family protein n=1 Tax=Lactococcus garvieae DCC43 TaxID=1231377 RepID=K2NSW9_9LACT|nr:PrgI family protein [Lactococcus garvieae]EKF50648.1 hypothetical protein C426_2000 [Lactococcus garvieae DCC43]